MPGCLQGGSRRPLYSRRFGYAIGRSTNGRLVLGVFGVKIPGFPIWRLMVPHKGGYWSWRNRIEADQPVEYPIAMPPLDGGKPLIPVKMTANSGRCRATRWKPSFITSADGPAPTREDTPADLVISRAVTTSGIDIFNGA